ncbi:MAG: hypothetical protein GMKNLPBB_02717 [Myxococcota bacterium]|nr:hypothetical protein [Myxococcota bacterium]
MNFQPVIQLLDQGRERRLFSGASIIASREGEVLFHQHHGTTAWRRDEPVSAETRFDLASLTKPLAISLLLMRLSDERGADLDDPAAPLLRELEGTPWSGLRLRHLLTHRSGLPAWRPFHESPRLRALALGQTAPAIPGEAKRTVLNAIARETPQSPAGEREEYSDLGFMLLGFWLERRLGEPLTMAFQRLVAQPLGADELFYLPRPGGADSSAPPFPRQRESFAVTGNCPWRGWLRGHVHDDNAFVLGGAAGHAGLFGTARGVHALACAVFRLLNHGGPWCASETARRFLLKPDRGSRFTLGWDTPSEMDSQAGVIASRSSFGHLGFTGTSLWIDPENRIITVILTNRVHPDAEDRGFRTWRPAMMDALYRCMGIAGSRYDH